MVAVSGRPIALVGDQSDHGGVIISGDPIATVNGRPVARVGDLHSCPQVWPLFTPHSITAIIPLGCAPVRGLIKGRPNALRDDLTGCGAKLITSQQIGASRC